MLPRSGELGAGFGEPGNGDTEWQFCAGRVVRVLELSAAHKAARRAFSPKPCLVLSAMLPVVPSVAAGPAEAAQLPSQPS